MPLSPFPLPSRSCSKIIQHFRLKNVQLFEKGVGEKAERLDFNVPLAEFGAISAGQAHIKSRNNDLAEREKHYQFSKSKTINCEIVKLDDFLPDLTQLSFVKIDIEGAEYFALRGMEGLLTRFKPVVLMEINPFFLEGFGLQEKSLADLIDKLDYGTYRYNADSRKLEHYTASSYVESNYILIHRQRVQNFAHLIDLTPRP